MSDTVLACPECDTAALRNLVDAEAEFWCQNCRARIDRPTERPSRSSGGPSAQTMIDRALGGDD